MTLVDIEQHDIGDDPTFNNTSTHLSWGFAYFNRKLRNHYRDADILIDTGSAVSIFKNKNLLKNIQRTKRTLRAFSNGGWQDSRYTGVLPKFFPVWYNKVLRLNILSFADVRKK